MDSHSTQCEPHSTAFAICLLQLRVNNYAVVYIRSSAVLKDEFKTETKK